MASQLLPRSELVANLKSGLQRCSKTLLIAGIALIILGSIAILAPGLATLLVTTFLGWLFIVSAIAAVVALLLIASLATWMFGSEDPPPDGEPAVIEAA